MPRGKPKPEEKRRRQQGTGAVFWNAKKSRYQATIDLGRDAEGKRVRKTYTAREGGKTTEAKDECERWLAQAQADYLHGTLLPPSRETVRGFLEGWLEHTARVGTETRTWTEYRRKLELYVYPEVGTKRLNDLHAQHIQAVYAKLLRTVSRRTGKPLSASTVRGVHRILHAALGRRIAWDEIKLPKAGEYEAPVLEPDEFTRLLAAAAGTRYEPIWYLMGMGFRPEEVLGLRRQDLDFRRGTATVAEVIPTKGRRAPKAPKTRRSRRTVQMPAQVMDLLAAHCEAHAEAILRAGGRVFCTQEGAPLSWSRVYRTGWRPLVERAGVTYVPPYSLRHGFVSYQIEDGVDLARISADVGHSNTATTARVYAHKLRKTEGRTAETIARLLPIRKAEQGAEKAN
ncbi:MAG: site-specific integrase [Chloroflexi bacterium]|nr:site-specific integrase [Chloroflexota bacterium]